MTKYLKRCAVAAAVAGIMGVSLQAQDIAPQQQEELQQVLAATKPANMLIGDLKVHSAAWSGDTLCVDVSENFGDVPFTRESVNRLCADMLATLGEDFSGRPVKITIAGADINNYFTEFDKSYSRKHGAFITDLDDTRHYGRGLDGNIVALWPSHGWYFEPKLNRWEWQRARMFQTVEDMYTHSYVIPFLIPMLENAGAYVWDARERDTHNFGAVVDNDGGMAQTGYTEQKGKHKWEDGHDAGFAYLREAYRDFENPFAEGTYRMAKAETNKKKTSTASWSVDMPQAGEYALYISYKSLPNSVHDALYTVNSLEGQRRFHVDQTMGGGVWVYLGTFALAKGMNHDLVTLSNLSADKNGVVTADAIRVGGGKGNIERRVALPTPENKAIAARNDDLACLGKDSVEYRYVGSGEHPWFHLGSRYYLQWSGFPRSVFSTSDGINDYTDDYRSRGAWVNYLAGGSDVLPGKPGLRIPVDVSFCLHTDAGTTTNDDIIGTLLIYCTKSNDKFFGKYANGTPRELSRRLADQISTEVVGDIRAKYEPNWTRRGMWDKSYYEARVPEVPAVLMELLSHQNFADMKYGLDPRFRFDVSRAIYKGILKFIAQRDHRDYVVQPLPVQAFAITREGDDKFLLTWQPTHDDRSANADPTRYVVLERVGRDGAFKEVDVVKNPQYMAHITDNQMHSYRIVAMNEGGRSFPSETLSAGVPANSKGTVLVVNAFTRVSAPDFVDGDKWAGFYDEKDHGVPYMQQINYLGSQFEFRRRLEWRDDDAPGFGACRSNHETEVIAGNTFDYPVLHGEAIMQAGYAFVSVSEQAFEQTAELADVTALDLILGKQKETPVGRGAVPSHYRLFSSAMRDAVTRYTAAGTHVLATGAYVGSDIWDRENVDASQVAFAKDVLGFEWVNGQATLTGEVYTVPSFAKPFDDSARWQFVTRLNAETYAVESPDAIRASDKRGATIVRYTENNIPAGVASDRGGYRTVVLGFPLEVMADAASRNDIMRRALKFFTAR